MIFDKKKQDKIMDYSIKRTGHFDVSYVGHVIFFTLAIEKAQKNIG
jgi:hypothetical protein